jgi:ribosome biogenesis GTPase
VYAEKGGACGALIDAPGLRSIGLYDAHDGLAATFPDIVSLAGECRYRDCSHSNEPGCAVTAAVAAGSLSERRLKSYCAIAAEVQD